MTYPSLSRPYFCESSSFPTLFPSLHKVIPPLGWDAKSKNVEDGFRLKKVVVQTATKRNEGAYHMYHRSEKTMTFKKFKETAGAALLESVSEVEDRFCGEVNGMQRNYAINNEMSLFGAEVDLWNLDRFTEKESIIHSKTTHHFAAVSSSHRTNTNSDIA